MRSCTVLAILALLPSVGSANTIWVPDDHPSIQAAIVAAVDGDEVIVRPGTYVENIDYLGKAITVRSELGPDVTTIDGAQGGSVVSFRNAEGPDSVLSGFTITNGSGTFELGVSWGGGIYCASSSPTITGNTIAGNTTFLGGGGGLACTYGASPVITGNAIRGNSGHQGGGIACRFSSAPIVRDNTIAGNVALWGGGIHCDSSSPVITDNVISGNDASSGGGIGCGNSAPTISGNTIADNTTSSNGGGIYCYDGASPTITGNTIDANDSSEPVMGNGHGGGISCYFASPRIEGNTISRNTSHEGGGGIHAEYSSPTIVDNTITSNISTFVGGGIYVSGGFPIIEANRITGNDAQSGGGISCAADRAIIQDNTITDNTAYVGGGFLCSTDLGLVETSGNTISANAAQYGGGIWAMGGFSPWATLYIEDSRITDNTAGVSGGGIGARWIAAYVRGCTIAGNTAGEDGGGMACLDSSLFVDQTILWDNRAPSGPQIRLGDSTDPSTLDIEYSDVQGGASAVQVDAGSTLNWGMGMLDDDPLFVNPAQDDYRLQQDPPQAGVINPCVDTGGSHGNGHWGTTRTDWVRDTGTVDMGFHYSIPAAAAVFRTGGANPSSYLATTLPVLGGTYSATVNVGTTGHSLAWLVGYATPHSLALGGGQVLLVNVADPAGELLAQPLVAGPVATYDVPVPSDLAYVGYAVATQALHVGGTSPFALSNALDLTIGF